MNEDIHEICAMIKQAHIRRRYSMKLQQSIDRRMESYVRVNMTDWHPNLGDKERDKINKQVAAVIKGARAGEGDVRLTNLVEMTDKSRAPSDKGRADEEKNMEALAAQLPVAAWVAGIRGAGLLGLATIIAEAGPLDRYANPQKLWKRLGYAPYDGYAGSTWKREKWRPRTLTSEEWIAEPFSGQRYAFTHQIVIWLVNAQWIGAAKSDTGEGKPNGPYGDIYARRRAHTETTHPDWTKGHRRMDALRITMKAFLVDLWCQWNNKQRTTADHASHDAHLAVVSQAAAHLDSDTLSSAGRRTNPVDHAPIDAHLTNVDQAAACNSVDTQLTNGRRTNSRKSKTADQPSRDDHAATVSRAADQKSSDTQTRLVGRTNSHSV